MWRLRNVWLTLYNRTKAYYVLFIYIFYAKVFSWYNKGLQTTNIYSGKENGRKVVRHDVEYVDIDCCLTPQKRATFIWVYIIMTISSFWRFSISPTQWAGLYTAIAFEETMGAMRGAYWCGAQPSERDVLWLCVTNQIRDPL